jgi:pimeloyl-ACP methyl ester carboxylesterase
VRGADRAVSGPPDLPARRRYGSPPYRAALLHGGPGALGYLAPVARRLAGRRGVLEPLLRSPSVAGQLDELRATLDDLEGAVTVVGHSWGAVLGYLLAARSPELVAQLVLVASAPFEERYAMELLPTRLARLDDGERRATTTALAALDDRSIDEATRAVELARLDALFTKADGYDLLSLDVGVEADLPDVYERVWAEVRPLRASGELVELGRRIRCPVLAVHGDHDPHPADGVRVPLAPVVADFRFTLLERCGHVPWLERHAQERFYELLEGALPSR